MKNVSSVARPYALAAFLYAEEKKQLLVWKTFLETAARISKNASVEKLLANREVSSLKIAEFFCTLLGAEVDEEKKNFLLLLAQNRRFNVLNKIVELFNEYYSTLEKLSAVRVVTAVNIKEDLKQKLIEALTKRIKRQVTLHCETDPAILGGAVIHMGDSVIDASIRGKLSRLLEFTLR